MPEAKKAQVGLKQALSVPKGLTPKQSRDFYSECICTQPRVGQYSGWTKRDFLGTSRRLDASTGSNWTRDARRPLRTSWPYLVRQLKPEAAWSKGTWSGLLV